jgi:hypothetical protein
MSHSLKIYYRPDNYPDWIPWRDFEGRFTIIGTASAIDKSGLPTARAGFAPRVSFGKPPDSCDDKVTSRSLRRGYAFQVRFVGSGHLTIDRFRIHGQKLIERSTATC